MVRQRAVNPWGNQLQVRVLSSEPFQCLLGRTVMQQTLNLCDVGSTPSAGTILKGQRHEDDKTKTSVEYTIYSLIPHGISVVH